MRPRPVLRLMLAALSLLLPMLALAASPAPLKEGVDYEVIPNGKPFAPLSAGKKVEVVEVFSYACVHCAHFETALRPWKQRQKSDVQFTPVASPLIGAWAGYARAYYAAQISGVLDKTHAAVFKALHEDGALPMNNPSISELTTFYAGYGVDPARFTALLEGPQVEAQLKKAREFAIASGVRGTPTLVINGKYRVTGGDSFEDVLRIADGLIARERKASK